MQPFTNFVPIWSAVPTDYIPTKTYTKEKGARKIRPPNNLFFLILYFFLTIETALKNHEICLSFVDAISFASHGFSLITRFKKSFPDPSCKLYFE